MADGSSGRAQLRGVELERLPNGRCLTRVKFGRKLSAKLQQAYFGESEGDCSPSSGMRCAAEATVQALQRAYGTAPDTITFLDIKTVESFDRLAVIVAIAARHEEKTWRLLGFCEVSEDLRIDVARAVCNGLNRFLTLTFPREP